MTKRPGVRETKSLEDDDIGYSRPLFKIASTCANNVEFLQGLNGYFHDTFYMKLSQIYSGFPYVNRHKGIFFSLYPLM